MKRKSRALRKRNASAKEYHQGMASYYGWCKHADCRHLMRRVMGDDFKSFDEMEIRKLAEMRQSERYFGLGRDRFVSIVDMTDREVAILGYKHIAIKGVEKVTVKFAWPEDLTGVDESNIDSVAHYTITRSQVIMDRLDRDSSLIPFTARFKKVNGKYFAYE